MTISILQPSEWGSTIREAWASMQKRIPWVMANPKDAQAEAKRAHDELEASHAALKRWKAAIGRLPEDQRGPEVAKFNKSNRLWYEAASALFQGATDPKSGQPVDTVGILPLIIVGVVALSLAGAAFAPAAFQVAKSLRVQADNQTRDLEARIEASKEGRTIQDATVPAPSASAEIKTPPGGGGGLLIAGLAVVAIGGAVWAATRAR